MSNAKLNKLCMEESDSNAQNHSTMQTWKFVAHANFLVKEQLSFFRWRDREEIDPRSQFILPKLVNKIKELEDEVWRRQIQINEQQVLIDNLTRERGSNEES
ncbi:hypothetical protein H5410_048925 [Solanum commersonii]|uniref:Uncharacterized protein n=1 Tax=Solanum commersonii TaxID=4109 RepID=A0A9J5XJL0_SOLCO|nr:hypothetical protein H5410_048925 [Solanum commersonii]